MTISQVIEKLTELQKIYNENMPVRNHNKNIINIIEVAEISGKKNVIFKPYDLGYDERAYK